MRNGWLLERPEQVMGSIIGPLLQPRPLPELTFAYRTRCEAKLPPFFKKGGPKANLVSRRVH